MAKTISTHNGSAANREHNIRNPRATDKQEHISKELKGQNEVLHDEKPREAYRRIFGAALDAYNAKQTRAERQIPNYYAHIEKDAKKHPVYEMIVQIGDRYDTGIDAPLERECLREFYAGWAERNPHLECIGAYIHADEADGTLHMHVDYVPWADGYKKGMEKQSALVKALEQQGFTKEGSRTAQIQWEARENATLEEICVRHGIEVIHPMAKGETRAHMDTEMYKLSQRLQETQEDLQLAEMVKDNYEAEALLHQEAAGEALRSRNEAQEEHSALSAKNEALRAENATLEAKNAVLETKVAELPALEAQISEAREELKATRVAIRDDREVGTRQFGSPVALDAAIKQAREKQKESSLAQFAQHLIDHFPAIQKLWQQWQQAQSRTKTKKREGRERGD